MFGLVGPRGATESSPAIQKLSQNYDPARDRATITETSSNWVAPTSYVGVAQRQEAY
jgi:hypothetical protein